MCAGQQSHYCTSISKYQPMCIGTHCYAMPKRSCTASTLGACAAELIQTITRSGISAGSIPLRWWDEVAFTHFIRDDTKSKLAQCRQVPLFEEVRERLFHLLCFVHFSLPQSTAQLFYRYIHVDHLVGPVEEGVGDGFSDAHSRRAADGVVQRLEVLDVNGSHDADAAVQQLEDFLIPFLMPAPRHVRVREFIDDTDLRPALQNHVDVHLF
jgi:hypothetical protein